MGVVELVFSSSSLLSQIWWYPENSPGGRSACILPPYQQRHLFLVVEMGLSCMLCSDLWSLCTFSSFHFSLVLVQHLTTILSIWLLWWRLRLTVSVLLPLLQRFCPLIFSFVTAFLASFWGWCQGSVVWYPCWLLWGRRLSRRRCLCSWLRFLWVLFLLPSIG